MTMNDEYALVEWLNGKMLEAHKRYHQRADEEEYLMGKMDAYQEMFDKIINGRADQRPHTRVVRE
jgi:hypothetical protein